ncbi:hypothetical protein A9K66_00010 [Mesorhizobium sp. AA23]|nr:hypothetical protein A9K66_00010 [Mesorhizobium sp. AA23]
MAVLGRAAQHRHIKLVQLMPFTAIDTALLGAVPPKHFASIETPLSFIAQGYQLNSIGIQHGTFEQLLTGGVGRTGRLRWKQIMRFDGLAEG